MANDTPESVSDDSQSSLISKRNEALDANVPTGMDDSSQTTDNRQQTTGNSVVSTSAAVDAPDAPAPDPVDDTAGSDHSVSADAPDMPWVTEQTGDAVSTGELEAIVVSETPPPLPTVEPPPTVGFDYDDYYGVTDSPPRPEPVSARIETAPPTNTGRKGRGGLFFLGALVAGAIGAVITLGVLAGLGTFTETQSTTATTVATVTGVTTTSAPVTNQIINEVGSSVNPTAVALKVVPSIVTVNVFQEGTDAEATLLPTGSGSGVVMSTDGYIITNNHVVADSTNYEVTFEDGRTYTASLIGTDALTDLAVLQISAANLVPIEFGSSDDLSVGDPAVAVGNPLGQDGGASVSAGILSAFERTVNFGDNSSLFGMLQTDAAINSGSSGGALVDAEGRLIGITSAIGVSQAGPEGIGYAIPVELVDRITAEIIETGDVQHPFLGVTIGTYLEEAPDGAIVPSGASIQTIEGDNSAAGTAGLQPGDVIIRIGDKSIENQIDLILAVRLNRVGDEVEFEALRNGESMTFDVIMGQRPSEFGG
ncbi:MAG: S1C family serine protease [Actinomycetia bacterium]|nr:S1C family serine protease [Actinomycetes bacterium]